MGAVALVMLMPAAANAQVPPCGPRAEIIAGLTGERYGERFVANGIDSTEITEFWGNPVTGSWTITGTDANGRTCLRAAGQGFQTEPFLDVFTGDPA
jgi:hypothetical protein